MGRVEPGRARQIEARLAEIGRELDALRVELGGVETGTPEQRRAVLRVVDGGRATASPRGAA